MTEEELVVAGTKAIAEAVRCQDSPAATVACIATGDCDCFGCARAVLAAVEPKIRADERERWAKFVDGYANEVREAGDRLAKLGRSTTASEAKYDAGLTLAAAIRADNYGRNPPK